MLGSVIRLSIQVFYVFWKQDIGRVRFTISKHWTVGTKMAAYTREAEWIGVGLYRCLEVDCMAAGVMIYRERDHLTAVGERC